MKTATTSISRHEIQQLLQMRKWSQAELARRLEVNQSAVSLWLSGKAPPSGPARILLRTWHDRALARRRAK